MKKLHIALFVLHVVSILFILQIVFDVLPLFPSGYTVEKAEKINNLVITLNLAIITSSFFYYLLVYIPEMKKQKTVRAIITPHLNSIADGMAIILAYFVDVYSLDSKSLCFDDLPLNSFRYAFSNKEINSEKGNVYVINLYSRTNYSRPFVLPPKRISIKTLSNNEFEQIRKQSEKILSLPTIIYEDITLIKTLSDINKCGIFSSSFILIDSDLNITPKGELKNMDYSLRDLNDFYKHYLDLLQYVKPQGLKLEKVPENEG